jgi:hypothetical protein
MDGGRDKAVEIKLPDKFRGFGSALVSKNDIYCPIVHTYGIAACCCIFASAIRNNLLLLWYVLYFASP